jgi:hypothetical protein
MRILIVVTLIAQYSLHPSEDTLSLDKTVPLKSLQEMCMDKVIEANLSYKDLPMHLQKDIHDHVATKYSAIYTQIIDQGKKDIIKLTPGDFDRMHKNTIEVFQLTHYMNEENPACFECCTGLLKATSPHTFLNRGSIACTLLCSCSLITTLFAGACIPDTLKSYLLETLLLGLEIGSSVCLCALNDSRLKIYPCLIEEFLPAPRTIVMEIPEEDMSAPPVVEQIDMKQTIQLLLPVSENDENISGSETDEENWLLPP